MTRYVVFDKKGIIHESDDFGQARREFEQTTEFEGDLIIAEILDRRH